MCGIDLTEEESAPEEEEQEESRAERELPGWAKALIVVALALLILSAGSFGLYTLMTAEPQPEEATPTQPTMTSRPSTTTPTGTPTRPPTPIPTFTPIPPLAHQVQPGETLIDIASNYDTTVERILALNPDLDPNLLQVDQVVLIPVPTPTPGPTRTLDPSVPTPTPPEYIVHIVEPNETLLSIAAEYDVSVPLIRTANDLPQNDDTIRVNQSLIIPLGTPMPSPTPTTDPNATSTLAAPYAAAPLLKPADGANILMDTSPLLLQWSSIGVLEDDQWYMVTLAQPSGGVISATILTRATAWRVPSDLLTRNSPTREFQWQVQIVQETQDRWGETIYRKAGEPSQVRTFHLLLPTPTPQPTSTP